MNGNSFVCRCVEPSELIRPPRFVPQEENLLEEHGLQERAPEVVPAAQERGPALDWWETAEELLEELRVLGWAECGLLRSQQNEVPWRRIAGLRDVLINNFVA
jgi:hypothetical protein